VMTMTTPDVLDLDTLTLAAVRAGALRDRPVTVLGLARSGIALTRFFVDAGAAVTVYDGRRSDELGEAIAALGGRAVRLMLGPDVDPSAAWAGASLVATSPSISPDFPTTEPALRSALRALVDARGAGDATVPSLLSEADLFLRLCPAPTVGVTGTKGKTTTSSLTAAILAAHPSHPVILGGNIGSPLIERVSELTPAHRVVDELSELQLPTLSRGTTVAAYMNVTADHLDRHGTLEAYRAVKRRLMELVPDGGAVVLNAEDAVVSTYEPRAGVTTVTYRRGAPVAGGMGVVDGWIVADGVPALDGGGRASSGQIMPVAELAIPGAHNISNALAGIATGLLFSVEPEAIRSAAAAFTGVEHRLEHVATVDGIRFINDSQGTQPDAVAAALRAFDAPIVLIAGGREGDRHQRARTGRRRTRVRGRAHRRERPRPRGRVPRRGPLPDRARARSRDGRPPGGRPRARRATRDCQLGRDGPAQPGGRELRHVRRLCGPRPRIQGRRRTVGGDP